MDTRVEGLVIEYLDGELDGTGAGELADHLASNEDDREEFIELARAARVLAAILGPASSGPREGRPRLP